MYLSSPPYMVRGRDHKAPRYVVFSSPLLLRSSKTEVLFLATLPKHIETKACIYARINRYSQLNLIFQNYGLKNLTSPS